MFEKFLRDNIDNFRQRYEGTFGFFRDANGKRLLVRIGEINGSRCNFEGDHGVSFYIVPDADENVGFEFLPPRSMWYNTPDGPMYVERVAQRQFQRGITSKNTLIYGIAQGLLTPAAVNFKNLSAIFEAPPPDAKQLRAIMIDKKQPFALSNSFMCDTTTGLIFLYREVIGKAKLEVGSTKLNFKIKLNDPDVWRTELNDAIVSLGHTAEIT